MNDLQCMTGICSGWYGIHIAQHADWRLLEDNDLAMYMHTPYYPIPYEDNDLATRMKWRETLLKQDFEGIMAVMVTGTMLGTVCDMTYAILWLLGDDRQSNDWIRLPTKQVRIRGGSEPSNSYGHSR